MRPQTGNRSRLVAPCAIAPPGRTTRAGAASAFLLQALADNESLDSRVRFLCNDVIEQARPSKVASVASIALAAGSMASVGLPLATF